MWILRVVNKVEGQMNMRQFIRKMTINRNVVNFPPDLTPPRFMSFVFRITHQADGGFTGRPRLPVRLGFQMQAYTMIMQGLNMSGLEYAFRNPYHLTNLQLTNEQLELTKEQISVSTNREVPDDLEIVYFVLRNDPSFNIADLTNDRVMMMRNTAPVKWAEYLTRSLGNSDVTDAFESLHPLFSRELYGNLDTPAVPPPLLGLTPLQVCREYSLGHYTAMKRVAPELRAAGLLLFRLYSICSKVFHLLKNVVQRLNLFERFRLVLVRLVPTMTSTLRASLQRFHPRRRNAQGEFEPDAVYWKRIGTAIQVNACLQFMISGERLFDDAIYDFWYSQMDSITNDMRDDELFALLLFKRFVDMISFTPDMMFEEIYVANGQQLGPAAAAQAPPPGGQGPAAGGQGPPPGPAAGGQGPPPGPAAGGQAPAQP
jgi:hypothetical protein